MSDVPRVRSDLVVRRLPGRGGEPYVMVKDPQNNRYFKCAEWEDELMRLIDGSRDVETLASDFNATRPDVGTDLQWMVDYVESLRQTGLIEKTEQEKHLVMMEKLKTLRKRRLYNAETSSIFQIQFRLFDPDDAMDRVIPWIRWLWSPPVIAFWVAVFAVVLGFLIYHWDLYWRGFFGLLDVTENTLWDWLALLALIFGVSIWHELGHGFTCKRFGGEVHDIGFMIFYFEPAFYCNIDDSYLFPRTSHRIYCACGGPYFELMLCAVSVALWLLTPVEWWIHSLALSLVFITGLSVLFNINPLIKLDGYYALMDWLDIPGLREDSFQYMGNLIKKHVFHLQVPETPISRRRRRTYLAYGVFSLLYTSLVMLLIYGLFRGWLVGWLGPTGYLVLFLLILYAFRRKLKVGVQFMRHLWLDKRDWALSTRGKAWTGVTLLMILLLLVVPSSPTRIDAKFVVEPRQRSVVRAPTDAMIRDVRVREGARVEAGQLLAVLASPDARAALRHAEADHSLALRQAAGARSEGALAMVAEWSARARESGARIDLFAGRLEELALRAPTAGIVTTYRVEDTVGGYLGEGETFCVVDGIETVLLAIAAPESDIEEVEPGVPVRMLAAAYPTRTLEAQVLALSPVAESPSLDQEEELDLVQRVNLVRILVEIENPDGILRPGMSGRVQFLTRERSPLGKLWWRFHRWAASVVW